MLPLPARPPVPSITSLRHDPDAGGSLTAYWTFYRAVAAAQLDRWLPSGHARVLDISGPRSPTADQVTAAGHTVIRVRPQGPVADGTGGGVPAVEGSNGGTAPDAPRETPDALPETPDAPRETPDASRAMSDAQREAPDTPREAADAPRQIESAHQVVAEIGTLRFLADDSVDGVIAEDRALSRHLVTETTMAEIARVLRPGGRVLLSVDSLMLGMAILAEQNYWAHLSDVPRAEVVLIPWPDGTITRCFWSEQLRELLTDAGFQVEWIRPRTVLSPSTVEHMLTGDPDGLAQLVQTELTAPVTDETVGIHLVASARLARPT